MKKIEINSFPEKIKKLIIETNQLITPNVLEIYEVESLPMNIDAQGIKEDYKILIRSPFIDEHVLSHEILHFQSSYFGIPDLVKVIDDDIVGMIGAELQGYLEHRWILAEQYRKGFDINEHKLYHDIQETIGTDEEVLEKNFKRILILNNIIHTHPSVYEQNKQFFEKNNRVSLQYAQRIMSHYPTKEVLSLDESRRATIKAIKEWMKIFEENGVHPQILSLLIIVLPVFSNAQLRRIASSVLTLIPNCIGNHQTEVKSHVFTTNSDGQCCCIFEGDQVPQITKAMNEIVLEDFLAFSGIPYYIRD